MDNLVASPDIGRPLSAGRWFVEVGGARTSKARTSMARTLATQALA